ncbi:hypothetical protein [Streptomyces sp. NBC_00576]|uniref:hypothetical protein n=1 Tax=Streptomyces sp. NBC_00576 TaxID=2903665 RepID=UPI002E81683B|nr:hypothetical protein [Streptomyces sp. NBC_00576]WUB70927.1 hypothetical protein OG734_12975 [Streptomyces sp. NBC_00576]
MRPAAGRRDLSLSLIEAHWVTDPCTSRRAAACNCSGAGSATGTGRVGQAVTAAAMVPAARCVLFTVVREAERRRPLARRTAFGGVGAVVGKCRRAAWRPATSAGAGRSGWMSR